MRDRDVKLDNGVFKGKFRFCNENDDDWAGRISVEVESV